MRKVCIKNILKKENIQINYISEERKNLNKLYFCIFIGDSLLMKKQLLRQEHTLRCYKQTKQMEGK